MFNWFNGGKPKSSLPDPTPIESQRTKQIEQLKKFHSVSEIQRDLEYRVNYYVQNTTISLYITLPPRFPSDKPMVKVSPAIHHPWVDEMMIVIGSTSINNFSVHSDLGKAIKEIMDEFERNPPKLIQQSFGGTNQFTSYQTPGTIGNQPILPAYTSSNTSVAQNYVNQVPMPTLPPSYTTSVTYQPPVISNSGGQSASELPGGYYKMPEIPISFSDMGKLSVNELESLLNNEEKINEIVSKLPQITQLYEDMESLARNNEHLARDNLNKKPVLEDKKRSILEKYDQLNELRDQFGIQSNKQDELLNSFKSQVIQDRLKIAASQAEEEAESLAEQLLEGKLSFEDFKKQYTTIRTLSHLRKAKEEKLHTVLLQYRTK